MIQMIGPELFSSLAQRSLALGANVSNNGAQSLENVAMEFEPENNRKLGDQYNLAFANHVKR